MSREETGRSATSRLERVLGEEEHIISPTFIFYLFLVPVPLYMGRARLTSHEEEEHE